MPLMRIMFGALCVVVFSLSVSTAQAQTGSGETERTIEQMRDRQTKIMEKRDKQDCDEDASFYNGAHLALLDGDKSVRPKCESLIINYAKVSRRLHERGEETPPDKKFAKIVMQIEVQEGVIEHLEALLAGEDKDSIMHRVYTIQIGEAEDQIRFLRALKRKICRHSGNIWKDAC